MQPVTSDDIFVHRVLGPLHATAHSDWAVLAEARADRDKDNYRTVLWLWSPQEHRIAVPSRMKPGSARLSGDGRHLAFLSSGRRSVRQVHVQETGHRNASRPIGEASTDWQSIQDWSPDGARLLLTRKVPWREDELDDPDAPQRPHVVTHLPYKQDGSGIRVGWRTLLVELDLVTGTRRTLVQGDFDVQSARWSPDGDRLLFVRTRSGMQRHLADVWIAKADGNDARQYTDTLPAVNHAAWSPDGRRIALAAGELEGDSLTELFVLDAGTGDLQRATRCELHLEAAEPVWHPDGRRVAVVAAMRGLHRIAVVDTAEREVRTLATGLMHVLALRATRDGLVYIAASMRNPNEYFRIDWDGGQRRRLSNFNGGWSRKRLRPQVKKRSFRVPDGNGSQEIIEAWVLTPGHAPGPWPVLVDMHGGPHSDTLVDFANHMYWYHLLSLGWMVVSPNAVGSSGYGHEFARRLRGHWGAMDLPQFLTVLGRLRSERLAGDTAVCGGKSYGGFLSAYAMGHCEAFAGAVISAPVADIESHFGTSDSGYYVVPYAMDGEIAQCRERYHRLSPLQDITRACGPVLLLQGEKDERCPIDQCEELFAALVRAGKAVKMVVYPGGSHSMAASGKPSHRVDYHHRVAHWAQQVLADRSAAGEDPRGDRAAPVIAAEVRSR